jgi:hypothetical protein
MAKPHVATHPLLCDMQSRKVKTPDARLEGERKKERGV